MTRLALLVSLVALAAVLGGCVLGASVKRSFSATVETTQVAPGTETFESPGRKVKDSVWKGSFRARLRGPARIAARALRLDVGRGRFVTRLDAVEDYSIGRATNGGIQLLTFSHRATGSICFSVSYVTTDHGKKYTGTFKTLGGTGRAARVRASGRFTETPNAQTPREKVAISGRGTGAVAPRKGLPARCRALRSL